MADEATVMQTVEPDGTWVLRGDLFHLHLVFADPYVLEAGLPRQPVPRRSLGPAMTSGGVRCWTRGPAAMNAGRSTSDKASSGSWVTRIVMPTKARSGRQDRRRPCLRAGSSRWGRRPVGSAGCWRG